MVTSTKSLFRMMAFIIWLFISPFLPLVLLLLSLRYLNGVSVDIAGAVAWLLVGFIWDLNFGGKIATVLKGARNQSSISVKDWKASPLVQRIFLGSHSKQPSLFFQAFFSLFFLFLILSVLVPLTYLWLKL